MILLLPLWIFGLILTISLGSDSNYKEGKSTEREKIGWNWIRIVLSILLSCGLPYAFNITSIFGYQNDILICNLFERVFFAVGTLVPISIIIFMFWSSSFKRFELKKWGKFIWITIFIISVLIWSLVFINRLEIISETIETKQERQIISFCNIPVQNVSGKVEGSLGSISGNISTSNELPYWYIDENGEGKYDCAIANNSKLIFYNDNLEPYIEIITYRVQTKTVHNYNGKEDIKVNKEWKEYIFHLPEQVKQYGF